ncbi:unnamed protein product, partial [Cylicocyclus nassatus]
MVEHKQLYNNGIAIYPEIDIADDLETSDVNKALSANQGVILNNKFGEVHADIEQISGKVDQLSEKVTQLDGDVEQVEANLETEIETRTSQFNTLQDNIADIEKDVGELKETVSMLSSETASIFRKLTELENKENKVDIYPQTDITAVIGLNEALGTKVENAEFTGEIGRIEGEIALKANQTDVESVKAKVDEHGNTLNEINDKINNQIQSEINSLNINKPNYTETVAEKDIDVAVVGKTVFVTFDRYIEGSTSNYHVLTNNVPTPKKKPCMVSIMTSFNSKTYAVSIDDKGVLIATLVIQEKGADIYPQTSMEAVKGLDAELNLKEDKSNKVPSFQPEPDDDHYPSEKLVATELNKKS